MSYATTHIGYDDVKQRRRWLAPVRKSHGILLFDYFIKEQEDTPEVWRQVIMLTGCIQLYKKGTVYAENVAAI